MTLSTTPNSGPAVSPGQGNGCANPLMVNKTRVDRVPGNSLGKKYVCAPSRLPTHTTPFSPPLFTPDHHDRFDHQ